MQTRQRRCCGRSAVGLVAFVLVVAACGDVETDAEDVETDAPLIVATTSIWADVVSGVACDGSVKIETVIPSGGDPHGFEPSLADRGQLESSVLVIANGLSLEEGLEHTLEAVEVEGTPVFRMTDHIDTIASTSGANGSGSDDPHVWFDPIRVSEALPELADELVRSAGLDPREVASCLNEYRTVLIELDAEIVELTAGIAPELRNLVTNHDALGYFADRYGFEVIGTVLPSSSTLAEANPSALEELAEAMEEASVRAIFVEAQHSAPDAEALAERVGDVELITLPTGGLGEPGQESDTYVGMLRTLTRRIVEGLS